MRTVLNISKHDAVGRRFNNLDARAGFVDYGWKARFACWTPRTESAEYVQQAASSLTKSITPFLGKLGRLSGNVNGFYRNSAAITQLEFYKQADLLHYHIVHEEYLSVRDWIKIAAEKPLVWTWHDPYMLSGHCIYSLGCTGFETGCSQCPHLDYHFPIKRDRSKRNLEEKLDAVKRLDPMVIVASEYMRDLVDRSLYGGNIRTSVVPFGVEMPDSMEQSEAKKFLGIPQHNIVIGFRAVYSIYKGLQLVQAALQRLSQKFPNLPVTIISFQEKGCCAGISSNYQLIEAGWIADSSISRYYSAMDFFLMPSKAEAFGLMAIEAMATGATPIVTLGTSLPDLVAAPIVGLCSEHSESSYAEVVEAAVLSARRNGAARQARIDFAKAKYAMEKFCRETAAIYDQEIEYSAGKRRPT